MPPYPKCIEARQPTVNSLSQLALASRIATPFFAILERGKTKKVRIAQQAFAFFSAKTPEPALSNYP